jgi:hypothetical protein
MVRFVPPRRPLPRRPDGSFCTVCVASTAVRCQSGLGGPKTVQGTPSIEPMIRMDHSLRRTSQVALVKWSDTAPGEHDRGPFQLVKARVAEQAPKGRPPGPAPRQ